MSFSNYPFLSDYIIFIFFGIFKLEQNSQLLYVFDYLYL